MAPCILLKRTASVTSGLQTGNRPRATTAISSLNRRFNHRKALESIVQALDRTLLHDKICQPKWAPRLNC